MTGDLLLQNDHTGFVEPDQMERVLADVSMPIVLMVSGVF
jgi:hypothetical protein